MERFILTDALLLTGGDNPKLIPGGAVVIEGEKILEVGETTLLKSRFPDARHLSARGKLVTPGFINSHTHFYSSFARGIPISAKMSNFKEILEYLWWHIDKRLILEDLYLSAMVAIIEGLKRGCTTVIDHHASPFACRGSLSEIARAVMDSGIRAVLCYEVSDRDGPKVTQDGIEENMEFIKKPKDKWKLASMFGLHASFTLSDETLMKCSSVAREVGFHIHTAEDKVDVEKSIENTGERVVKRLHRFGITGKHSIFAHCVYINEKEIEILANTGTAVVHNPRSNMGNAVGVAKVEEMLEAGITVGLGTDGYYSDMPQELLSAFLIHKLNKADPRAFSFDSAYKVGMINSSNIASRYFPAPFGVIAPGYMGDLVVWNYLPPTPITSKNFMAHILFGLTTASVDTVIVGSKVLMEGGRFLLLEEEEIFAEAQRVASNLWKRI